LHQIAWLRPASKIASMKSFNKMTVGFFISFLMLSCFSSTNKESIEREKTRDLLYFELENLGSDRSIMIGELNTINTKIANFEQQLFSVQSELDDYNIRVKAYLMNHKMAVSAIAVGAGGLSVALSDSNEFSSEVKNVGTIAAVLAGIYALNNFDEVTEVVDVLNQADSHVKDLKNRIAELTGEIDNTRFQKSQFLTKISDLDLKVASLRDSLEGLRISQN
jgi:uncharacterized protein YlxW (UPF0749 family)